MAGLSLRCGDCGALLRTVEEAQEHAELTSHSDFSESTEAVLSLVCTTCRKPCRSKTETDLHTKRTGHADFADKTLEAAKPIDLVAAERPSINSVENAIVGSAAASGSEPSEEMVIPEVDKKLLEELESMGFSTARATRALHFSGNDSVEVAINWVADHEDDPDIDQMPLIPISSKQETSKPSLTTEDVMMKAQELRNELVKEGRRREKDGKRKREGSYGAPSSTYPYPFLLLIVQKVIPFPVPINLGASPRKYRERIRVGKELLAAKRMEEENERKRIIELRKAEKEEEKRARDKIRQRLEEDKAERRRKLGLPPEDAGSTKPPPPPVEEKKSALPIKPVTKVERMRDCLRALKQNHKEDDAKVKRAFQTLLTYVGNVARNPDEEKFRKIRQNNPTFQDRVGSLHGGVEFLELCGFEQVEGGEFLFLPRDKVDIVVLNSAGSELNSAITNPFFGVL
ncbi:hypothetical protein HPP92_021423 [Vanilla planifolia]|uniref:UBA domain-containing protein n=1 Tax=Vanilla planifolia TaxID=51239 RepID=A0A835UIY7_VANPL|nr:hypothetical protein HPP92_021423 [Vanilla planifolia]